MPRVVDDQRQKFHSDELFRKLSRESEVSQNDSRSAPSHSGYKRAAMSK